MKMLPVGTALVRAGVITLEQAADAAAAQRVEGGLIGQHLILAGAVTRRDMYAALATQWRAPVIDLVANPPDADLTTGEPHEVVARGWVPCSLQDDVAVVATSVPPTGERLLNMRQATGATTIVLRTATDWDVFQAVAGIRRSQLLDEALSEGGASATPSPRSRAVRLIKRLAIALVVVAIVAAGVAVSPGWTLVGLFVLTDLLLVGGLVVRLVLAAVAASVRSDIRASTGEQARASEAELPVYSVLVPSGSTSPDTRTLVEDMAAQHYPKSKLDVLLLVGEDDASGIDALKASRPPDYMRILRVPSGLMGSEAGARNYGLAFARGDFVVSYRPGDRPQVRQLVTAVETFASSRRNARDTVGRDALACVQATVVHADAASTRVARISAVELAGWFENVLPAATDWGIATPLTGASEHFDTKELRAVGAWDPDDGAEGADLATRLATARRRVGVLPSTTTTRAPADLTTWLDVRTRWTIGFLLTTAAGVRGLRHGRRVRGALAGTILLVASPLGFLALPLALFSAALLVLASSVTDLTISPWLVVAGALWPLVAFVALALQSGRAAARTYGWRTATGALIAPVLWVLQTWPMARAAGRLLTPPLRS